MVTLAYCCAGEMFLRMSLRQNRTGAEQCLWGMMHLTFGLLKTVAAMMLT
jgi:hypothetical protein